MVEEEINSESRPKVCKVELDEEDSDYEYHDKCEEKPVNVDIGRELTEGNKSTLAPLPNKSEEDEIISNGETGVGDGYISLCRSN